MDKLYYDLKIILDEEFKEVPHFEEYVQDALHEAQVFSDLIDDNFGGYYAEQYNVLVGAILKKLSDAKEPYSSIKDVTEDTRKDTTIKSAIEGIFEKRKNKDESLKTPEGRAKKVEETMEKLTQLSGDKANLVKWLNDTTPQDIKIYLQEWGVDFNKALNNLEDDDVLNQASNFKESLLSVMKEKYGEDNIRFKDLDGKSNIKDLAKSVTLGSEDEAAADELNATVNINAIDMFKTLVESEQGSQFIKLLVKFLQTEVVNEFDGVLAQGEKLVGSSKTLLPGKKNNNAKVLRAKQLTIAYYLLQYFTTGLSIAVTPSDETKKSNKEAKAVLKVFDKLYDKIVIDKIMLANVEEGEKTLRLVFRSIADIALARNEEELLQAKTFTQYAVMLTGFMMDSDLWEEKQKVIDSTDDANKNTLNELEKLLRGIGKELESKYAPNLADGDAEAEQEVKKLKDVEEQNESILPYELFDPVMSAVLEDLAVRQYNEIAEKIPVVKNIKKALVKVKDVAKFNVRQFGEIKFMADVVKNVKTFELIFGKILNNNSGKVNTALKTALRKTGNDFDSEKITRSLERGELDILNNFPKLSTYFRNIIKIDKENILNTLIEFMQVSGVRPSSGAIAGVKSGLKAKAKDQDKELSGVFKDPNAPMNKVGAKVGEKVGKIFNKYAGENE